MSVTYNKDQWGWDVDYEYTLADLNEIKALLEGNTIDDDSLIEALREAAVEIAEDLEIVFIYDDSGVKQEYTPRAHWEPSGSCSWEESAQYGYDYGWNI